MTGQDDTADEDYGQGVVPLTERHDPGDGETPILVDTGTDGSGLTSSEVWGQEFHGRINLFPPMEEPGVVLELALSPEMYEEFERTAEKHGGDPTDLMRDLVRSAACETVAFGVGLEVEFGLEV